MQIETYQVDEITGGQDELASIKELCLELGLTAQQKYLTNNTNVVNFRMLTAEEELVYSHLCNNKTPINLYDSSVIPLRILMLAKKAMETGIFKQLMIWHPADASRDPILVGLKKHKDEQYNKDGYDYMHSGQFILGRWGEVLESFDELRKRAIAAALDKISHWDTLTILEKAK